MNEIGLERIFNLGDYKNLKVRVDGSELSDIERQNLIVSEVLAVFETYYWHQKVLFELADRDTTSWDEGLVKVQELRDKYIQEVQE